MLHTCLALLSQIILLFEYFCKAGINQCFPKRNLSYCKRTSLDTRHDLKLSFPSDFSKTDDSVSLTYEGCYKAVGYYTVILNASPELKAAFIEAMAQHGIDADNCNGFLKREWDIWA